MKNKILLVIAVIGILSFGLKASAAVSYSRTPAGSEITSPVNFQITLDSYADTGCPENYDYWGLYILSTNPDIEYKSPIGLASTSLMLNENVDLEVGNYFAVIAECCNTTNCPAAWTTGSDFPDTAFSVVAGQLAGTLITLPGGFVAGMLAWVKNTFTDLSSLIAIFLGLPLAFWGISKVIDLMRFSKVKKDD